MSVAHLAVMAVMELLHSSLELTHEAISKLKMEGAEPPIPHGGNLPQSNIHLSGMCHPALLLFSLLHHYLHQTMHAEKEVKAMPWHVQQS